MVTESSITVKVTKFRKGGLIISKRDAQAIEARSNINFADSELAKLKIGNRSFFPKRRTDGRIEIPSSVVRRKVAKEGVVTLKLVQAKKGDSFTRRQKFLTARRDTTISQKYFFEEIEDVDTAALSTQITNDIMRRNKKFFYIRLSFIFEKEDGEIFAFIRTASDIEKKFSRSEIYAIVNANVISAFVEAEEILKRPYIVNGYFARYGVYAFNFINAPVMVRNI